MNTKFIYQGGKPKLYYTKKYTSILKYYIRKTINNYIMYIFTIN